MTSLRERMLAELNRRRSSDEPAVTFGRLAELFGTTAEQIQADIRRLTFHDSSESEWLLSLQLLVEGDRVEGGSCGPFRRPMRLASRWRTTGDRATSRRTAGHRCQQSSWLRGL